MLLSVAAALTLQAARAQDKYTLQYKFEEGKAFRLADATSVNVSQEVMGQEMKSTSTMLATMRIVPAQIRPDGIAVLLISPDSLRFAIKAAQMDTTIVLTELIGKRTRLLLSRLGDFSKREVVDTVKLQGLAAQAGQRELVRFHTFSAKPVGMGEKWTSTRSDTTETDGGSIVMQPTIEYTLVSKEQQRGTACLKITYAGKIAFSGKGNAMGGTYFVEGTGTISGTVFVNPVNGLPVTEDSKADMESTVALKGQQSMTIPSSQSITSHRILLNE
jgi:hypothetical protein